MICEIAATVVSIDCLPRAIPGADATRTVSRPLSSTRSARSAGLCTVRWRTINPSALRTSGSSRAANATGPSIDNPRMRPVGPRNPRNVLLLQSVPGVDRQPVRRVDRRQNPAMPDQCPRTAASYADSTRDPAPARCIPSRPHYEPKRPPEPPASKCQTMRPLQSRMARVAILT